MESYTKLAIVAIVLIAALVTEPLAVNGLPICGVTTDDLQTCQPAVAKDVDPLPQPTADCCTALRNADMSCFCKLKDKYPGVLAYYKIDPKRAMDLPRRCNITQAPNFHC
ncbi:putative lipid-transfer protein DIR1 [Rutidosis leptorrhynchoides]|uniref:putative lipid-transfer protein DIR1 n=1 Tax=Rutidosis leptorrhynchoides TaxID=125765 RepID=UPI003A9958FD